jgi:hypothetical protein
VAREKDDWRLTNQEGHLREAALTWKRYHARRETWDHDHCAFCWAKFMDPDLSKDGRRVIEANADVLTEGYATTAEHERGPDYHWICRRCFEDFSDLFRWRVVKED